MFGGRARKCNIFQIKTLIKGIKKWAYLWNGLLTNKLKTRVALKGSAYSYRHLLPMAGKAFG